MTTTEEQGRKMLAAIERVLASNDQILAGVAQAKAQAYERDSTAARLISRYATSSAIAGGLAAAPGIVPGWGTIGVLGTVVAEMVYVLKTEVELCLSLASLYGLDVRRDDHRQFAFLLAAVGAHDVSTGRSILTDLGAASWEATAALSGREVSKLLLRVLAAIFAVQAARGVGRGLLRMIPLVGVGIGAGVNHALTARVGKRAVEALRVREQALSSAPVG